MKKSIGTIFLLFAFLTIQSQDKNTSAFSAETNIFENNALNISNQIEVYPNPSVDYVIVNIKNSTLKETTFEMHSVIGNTVDLKVEQLGKNRYRIDVKEYTSGYYFLVVKDDVTQFKEAYKFLKK